MFIPITREEIKKLGWKQLDIILVTGDAYIDSSFIGVALLGKFLIKHGYKVALIPQPDWKSEKDITRFGEPKILWGISAGSVDSMVANYTATLKKRKKDDYTPGGINNKRPDRATIVYSNLIRRYFKNTSPIVLGGIEASLRRIAHYDYWSNSIRRSILFDAKATYLLYGMAEYSLLELTRALEEKKDPKHIRGLCYIAKEKPKKAIEVPSFEEVKTDKEKFTQMFLTFYQNSDPFYSQTLAQKHGDRFLIQNPPPLPLTPQQMDAIYDLPFENRAHPHYAKQGKIKALETIQFAVTTHRGCYGGCHFCAIPIHQGRIIQNRSQKSILKEIQSHTKHPDFKGIIPDVGGPTANMYLIDCYKKIKKGSCKHKSCLFPTSCKKLTINHKPQIELLKKIRQLPGIKKVFVASGLRYDLILHDQTYGELYLRELLTYHTSGQLKIAPEHIANELLELMGKPSNTPLIEFKKTFDQLNKKLNKKQFLTYYFIAAHPGCLEKHMQLLREFAFKKLKIRPRQIQIFTPTPSTISTLMYFTEKNPFTGEKIFVVKSLKEKQKQKDIVLGNSKKYKKR